ncbi:MAG: hypothetical protein K0R57_778 [Paenibacillaceae bacterium]|jgi:two-component system sensor histidine kinase YesM|nr:hypothetical protein [Paenibacillaceae bacterium]
MGMMSWMKGITFKLFVICLVFAGSTVLMISVLFYNYIKEDTIHSRVEQNRQILQKVKQYLDMYFLMIENTHYTVLSTIKLSMDNREILQNQLDQLYLANGGHLKNIYIINEDLSIIGGNVISKAYDEPLPERQRLYEQALANPLSIKATEPYMSAYSGRTITVTRLLSYNNENAVLAFDLDLEALEDHLLRIGDYNDYKIGILHQSGVPVAQSLSLNAMTVSAAGEYKLGTLEFMSIYNAGKDVFTAQINGAPATITKLLMPRQNWIVYSVLDETPLRKSLERLRAYSAGLGLVGFLLSLVTAFLVSRFIRRPVYYLKRKMREVRNGNLDIVISNHRQDEFGELADTFDDMIGRIRHLISHLNVSEQMKRDMEIQVLQSQINPHFLYNALGSISNVVALGRTGEVDRLVRSLISILEYGIADASDRVTLREELRNVKDYLYIQNIRYDQMFALEEQMDAELLDAPVLRMILQPVVENGIFHGYQGGTLEGTITVSACRDGGRMIIAVSDEGVGMEEELAGRILQRSYGAERPKRRQRIGLYNIHKRIQLYYGEDYGVEVSSKPGEGTVVRLAFPL